ncbi:MAG: biotin-dependent carboxyltransferase family protein [Spirosomaceae bacterium]|jgi:antagonist of KipI|nr:biotin-dependent carboxyltransferase family protein [Spirosomataceae bacterium]
MLFLKSGILTTIQDLGRNGHRSAGINPNGTMDKYAVRLINILLNNDENEGALEIHFPAAEILFEEDCTIAIGGADFLPILNNRPINSWKRVSVSIGDRLSFSRKNYGNRAYLAVSGGFKIEKWLDSVSTNLAARIGNKFEKGDRIELNGSSAITINPKTQISPNILPPYQTQKVIRIITGNEYTLLDEYSKQKLQNQTFTIGLDSNRMGYRLIGQPLKLTTNDSGSILSSAVDFGTIQFLPSGQLIILMADHQTSGGYPRIGHVVSVDLPILAQLGAKDSFKFQIIGIKEAQELLFLREEDMKKLKLGVKLNCRTSF